MAQWPTDVKMEDRKAGMEVARAIDGLYLGSDCNARVDKGTAEMAKTTDLSRQTVYKIKEDLDGAECVDRIGNVSCELGLQQLILSSQYWGLGKTESCMVRDDDLVRKIIIKVADEGHDPNETIEPFEIDGYDEEAVSYHIWLLEDAGFLTALDLSTSDGTWFAPKVLTHSGQEFLAAVRDKDIWNQTKALAKQGGVGTLQFMWKIAQSVGKAEFRKRTGIDID